MTDHGSAVLTEEESERYHRYTRISEFLDEERQNLEDIPISEREKTILTGPSSLNP